jgi:hypothetical protein
MLVRSGRPMGALAFTVFGPKLVKVNLSGGPPQVLCDSDSTAGVHGVWMEPF